MMKTFNHMIKHVCSNFKLLDLCRQVTDPGVVPSTWQFSCTPPGLRSAGMRPGSPFHVTDPRMRYPAPVRHKPYALYIKSCMK